MDFSLLRTSRRHARRFDMQLRQPERVESKPEARGWSLKPAFSGAPFALLRRFDAPDIDI
jgi:hypothetical protein